jgi:hypothetical protein
MGEWRYSSTIFDLCTRWSRVVSSTPLLSYPLRKVLGTRLTAGWEGLRACIDTEEKRIILQCWESNRGISARSPPFYRLSYPCSLDREELVIRAARMRVSVYFSFLVSQAILYVYLPRIDRPAL